MSYDQRESSEVFRLAAEAGASPQLAHLLLHLFTESQVEYSDIKLLLTAATLGELSGYLKIFHREQLSPLVDSLQRNCLPLTVPGVARKHVPFVAAYAKEFKVLARGITDSTTAQDIITTLNTLSKALYDTEINKESEAYKTLKRRAEKDSSSPLSIQNLLIKSLDEQQGYCQEYIGILKYYIQPLASNDAKK